MFDPSVWASIGKIASLSGTGMLALVVVGFLKGWIWPGFAVQDMIRQRDALLRQNERLAAALARCLKTREAE